MEFFYFYGFLCQLIFFWKLKGFFVILSWMPIYFYSLSLLLPLMVVLCIDWHMYILLIHKWMAFCDRYVLLTLDELLGLVLFRGVWWHSLDTWVVCDQCGTSVTLTRKIMQVRHRYCLSKQWIKSLIRVLAIYIWIIGRPCTLYSFMWLFWTTLMRLEHMSRSQLEHKFFVTLFFCRTLLLISIRW
jgi:hypothetical protein